MLFYLASPYSHEDNEIQNLRKRIVGRLTADLKARGMRIYCPIVYSTCLQDDYGLVFNHQEWMDFDFVMLKMLKKCDAMIIAEIPGWEDSKEVNMGINFCRENSLPIMRIGPTEILEYVKDNESRMYNREVRNAQRQNVDVGVSSSEGTNLRDGVVSIIEDPSVGINTGA